MFKFRFSICKSIDEKQSKAVGDGLKKLVLVFPRTRDPVPVLMIP